MTLRRNIIVVLAAGLIALIPLTGAPVLAATTATDDAYEVAEDQVLAIEAGAGVLANDNSDDGELCVTGTVGAEFEGSLDGVYEDGSFTYTPPADFHGTTSFGYSVAFVVDGVCSDDVVGDTTPTVTITVNPVNDAPTARADSFQALRDRTLNVAAPGVLLNDGDVDGDGLTAVKESNPAHGSLTLAADGGFSYTPAAGYVGPDGFSYRASDGSDKSPVRVVSITVTAVPTPAPTVAATPAPTAPPTAAPEPSATPSPEASASPNASASASAGPSAGASPSPAPSLGPGEPAADAGGLSIPVLAIGLLLASLLAFGGAVLLPKWLEQRRADDEPEAPE